MNYQQKYLKYKNKYLQLKKIELVGGASIKQYGVANALRTLILTFFRY